MTQHPLTHLQAEMHGLQSMHAQHPAMERQTSSARLTHIVGLQQCSGTQSLSCLQDVRSATAVSERTHSIRSHMSNSTILHSLPSGHCSGCGCSPPVPQAIAEQR